MLGNVSPGQTYLSIIAMCPGRGCVGLLLQAAKELRATTSSSRQSRQGWSPDGWSAMVFRGNGSDHTAARARFANACR